MLQQQLTATSAGCGAIFQDFVRYELTVGENVGATWSDSEGVMFVKAANNIT